MSREIVPVEENNTLEVAAYEVNRSDSILKSQTLRPFIDNRVRVIQSIGNPKKNSSFSELQINEAKETHSNKKPDRQTFLEEDTTNSTSSPSNKNKLLLEEKSMYHQHQTSEDKLPSNTSRQVSPLAIKPKYSRLEHYRELLLGFSKDDKHNKTIIEDNTEEEEIEEDAQVFPVHWRKRTSQNFLFRRN